MNIKIVVLLCLALTLSFAVYSQENRYKKVLDTQRVEMLVSQKSEVHKTAFSMTGYEVREYFADPNEGYGSSLVAYLDDRRRRVKNLNVWQVRYIRK